MLFFVRSVLGRQEGRTGAGGRPVEFAGQHDRGEYSIHRECPMYGHTHCQRLEEFMECPDIARDGESH